MYMYICVYICIISHCVGECERCACRSHCVSECGRLRLRVAHSYDMIMSRHIPCNVLQCVAVCGSVLQCVVVCCSALLTRSCVIMCRGVPRHTGCLPTHCSTLQHTATHCNTLQHSATLCNTLQHTATHCNTLQHTAYLKMPCYF